MDQQQQNTGPCTSDGTSHRVRRTESTQTDFGDELTVICQVRRCYRPFRHWKTMQDSDLEQYSLSREPPANIRINLILPITKSYWATSSSLILWVYLHSNFRGGLQKTHAFWNRVRNGPSRSSKVMDFGTNGKRVCDFLLVVNSNLGPILPRFRDITGFLLRTTPPLFHPNFRGVPFGLDCWCCGSEERKR